MIEAEIGRGYSGEPINSRLEGLEDAGSVLESDAWVLEDNARGTANSVASLTREVNQLESNVARLCAVVRSGLKRLSHVLVKF